MLLLFITYDGGLKTVKSSGIGDILRKHFQTLDICNQHILAEGMYGFRKDQEESYEKKMKTYYRWKCIQWIWNVLKNKENRKEMAGVEQSEEKAVRKPYQGLRQFAGKFLQKRG